MRCRIENYFQSFVSLLVFRDVLVRALPGCRREQVAVQESSIHDISTFQNNIRNQSSTTESKSVLVGRAGTTQNGRRDRERHMHKCFHERYQDSPCGHLMGHGFFCRSCDAKKWTVSQSVCRILSLIIP